MKRRNFIISGASALFTTAAFPGQLKDISGLSQRSQLRIVIDPAQNIIPAPKDPILWPAYRDQLHQWREETRRNMKYDDSLYRRPEFTWAASSYACYFLMMCDEAFYDHVKGHYKIEEMLDEGVREFGGFDSLVLWHAYPRIGVDQRNQFDFYRDMPGGLEGVRNVVHACQKRGVHVYINYNPWDTGTRREEQSIADMLAEMVRNLDVDGIFLDTMSEGGAEFRAKLDDARPGVILESEGTPPMERIQDHHASWAQHFIDSEAPGVLRLKWIERRHLQHQIYRWKFDHTSEIHAAWMNGSGIMVWENVFGSWVAWNARDRSLLRSMLPIQRRFTDLFSGDGWIPLVPVLQHDIYASLWTDGKVRLWTMINRSDKDIEGTLLKVNPIQDQRYFDLIAGEELAVSSEKEIALTGKIAARGLGCFLAASTVNLGVDFLEFLDSQAAIYKRMDDHTLHPHREVQLKPSASTPKIKSPPRGMVAVHPDPAHMLTIHMRSRECGFYDSMTENEEGFWNESYLFHSREFVRKGPSSPYAMDETPVTNDQYAEFLKATRYQPKHKENFLRHWISGMPPAGKSDHPVVWVALEDARAYALWAGKRLPTEEEWQYAAQGEMELEYPWGDGLRAGVCNQGETSDTIPVKTFPEGRSPLGCYDLCGNVWQWTESERTDGRTRFCIIRGGSYFSPKGSFWYVDGGPRPAHYATKFLLMWPGLDRCATIGFRCAIDLSF